MRSRIARWLIAVAVVVVAAVVALAATRSSSGPQIHKQVRLTELRRFDAAVALPSGAASSDAAALRASLERTRAVKAYAPIPADTLALVLKLGSPGSTLGVRACNDPALRAFAVELSRAVPDAPTRLTAAIAGRADLQLLPKQGVDVEIYMEVRATTAEVASVRAQVEADPDVVKVTFLDHAGAFREFKTLFEHEPAVIAGTTAASLPESFQLQVRDGVSSDAVSKRFDGRRGVKTVVTQSNQLWTQPQPRPNLTSVEIFMAPHASASQIEVVGDSLAGDPAVRSFRFVSKQDALVEFRKLFADEPKLLEGTTADPLPASFRVVLADPGDAKSFERRYNDLPGVQTVNIPTTTHHGACSADS